MFLNYICILYKCFMPLRVVLKYGLAGGFFIVIFAFLKSEWFYSGLYPDVFLTFIALFFAIAGMMFRKSILKNKNPDPEPDKKAEYQSKLKQLSRRELEVLELLYSKHSNQEIADKLFIELSTLKTHINSIYKKLGVRNRKDLWLISDSAIIFN